MKSRIVGWTLALMPMTATAQTTVELGTDFETFEHVPVQAEHVFSTRTNRTLDHLQLVAGLAFSAQDDPVVVRFGDGEQWRVVDHRVTANLYAAMGLSDWVELAISAPMIVSQSAQDSPADYTAPELSSLVPGDLRLHAHLTWLRAHGFGLGTAAVLVLPTGDAKHLTSTDNPRLEPSLILDFEHTAFLLAVQATYVSRPQSSVLNHVVDDQIRWSAAADVPITTAFHLGASVFGAAGLGDEQPGLDKYDTPVEFLAGPRAFLPFGLMAHAAAGSAISSSVGAPDFRIVAGLEWSPEPLVGKPSQDDEQLAIAPSEPDEQIAMPDCVATPDAIGCPILDGDQDGVPDNKDRCPEQAEDADGFKEDDGCPDLDNDSDGIPDTQDSCPLEPETINGVSDDDGCPDEGQSKVRVTADRIDILERVYFDTNKDTIQPKSFGVLEQVAQVLKSRPDITRLRVEGHTDDRGNDAYNLDLSQRRAAAVRQFLIDKGIAADRLVARGYGESHPIGDNTTAAGRDTNRRVEFHIITLEEK